MSIDALNAVLGGWKNQTWDPPPLEGVRSLRAWAVLVVLANYADANGESYPSVPVMARHTGMSERSVQRGLDELLEAGLVAVQRNAAPDERIRRDRKPNLYRLTFINRGDNAVTPHGVTDSAHGVTDRAPRGDRSRVHGVTTLSPKPSIEPSMNRAAPQHAPGFLPGTGRLTPLPAGEYEQRMRERGHVIDWGEAS